MATMIHAALETAKSVEWMHRLKPGEYQGEQTSAFYSRQNRKHVNESKTQEIDSKRGPEKEVF